jgi:hypothetical protein
MPGDFMERAFPENAVNAAKSAAQFGNRYSQKATSFHDASLNGYNLAP